MTLVEQFAKLEHKIRPYTVRMNPTIVAWIISNGRKPFLSMLANDKPQKRIKINPAHRVKLWDIEFNSSLFNAAGIFKNGEGYYTMAAQGAGAYLAGTSTMLPRTGNSKHYTKHPVAAFPYSGMAINWMGLPNSGHEHLADKISRIEKINGCPVAVSISSDPAQKGKEALDGIITGLELFTKANVDFIELNESCPNVEHTHSDETVNGIDKSLVDRLEYISGYRRKKLSKYVPLIVKFSNDTFAEQVPSLVNLLITLGFDGVNFGNTSTNYKKHREILDIKEKKLYDYFTGQFGGGVSGTNLKSSSYALSSLAVNSVAACNPNHEFHIVRTGGIENADDIQLSGKSGISLNEWFTGYFDAFAKYGHNLYEVLFSSIDSNNLS